MGWGTCEVGNERTPPLEQPKDYAPKGSPDEQGALAEEYGYSEPEKEATTDNNK